MTPIVGPPWAYDKGDRGSVFLWNVSKLLLTTWCDTPEDGGLHSHCREFRIWAVGATDLLTVSSLADLSGSCSQCTAYWLHAAWPGSIFFIYSVNYHTDGVCLCMYLSYFVSCFLLLKHLLDCQHYVTRTTVECSKCFTVCFLCILKDTK
jgi:hypothetical protein